MEGEDDEGYFDEGGGWVQRGGQGNENDYTYVYKEEDS